MQILEIYQSYYTYIHRYAMKLTCHPDDALDLTQTVFCKAMQKLDTLEHEEAVASWLRSICFHEFLNMAKSDPKKYLLEVEDWTQLEQDGHLLRDVRPLPEDEVVVADEIRALQSGCFYAMVRKLTLHQRIAFSLTDMYGMPIGTIAALLGISVGAAKGLLYRARMNIDSFFADHCNLLDEKNPCSCKAWIEFSRNRNELQQNSKKLLERLDEQHKDFAYNEGVRRKVLSLYRNLPETKPPEAWYQSVYRALAPES